MKTQNEVSPNLNIIKKLANQVIYQCSFRYFPRYKFMGKTHDFKDFQKTNHLELPQEDQDTKGIAEDLGC